MSQGSSSAKRPSIVLSQGTHSALDLQTYQRLWSLWASADQGNPRIIEGQSQEISLQVYRAMLKSSNSALKESDEESTQGY